MKRYAARQGSAIITAIGMGIVLMFIMAAIHTFSSYRMQTTIQESRKVKALGLAEAGLELAIGELFNNSGFETHELAKDLKWLGAKSREQNLKDLSAHGLKIDNNSTGVYSGTLGDGKFKVRVGRIPYKDDDKTKNTDESLSYIKIESLGIYDTTVRRVEAVINRRFPAREFLMYDGGFLSMVFGQTNKNNKNVFSTGHLYGHKGIEIGRILMSSHNNAIPGTTQELDDMNAIISGAGGIFIYSPIQSTFRAKPGLPKMTKVIPTNTVFPTAGTYDNPADIPFGAYPKELEGKTPALPEDLKPWIKDKHSGLSIPPRAPPFEQYKLEAKSGKGLYIATNDSSNLSVDYKMPTSWTNGPHELDVAYLDFGSNLRESKVTVPENGVIYSEKDVVIKGNPPKNISIISAKNVFVAGDFNQGADRNAADGHGFYGFPQDYDDNSNALIANDYSSTVKSLFLDDVNDTAYKNHVAATVIARERVVYDYRSPVDCFENELVPFMKYKLAEKISDEGTAKANCLDRNKSGIIEAKATVEEFEQDIDSFFNEFPINSAAHAALKTELKQSYEDNAGKFDFAKFDEASMKVWKEYAKNYEKAGLRGAVSNEASTSAYGVYGLLNGLKVKMGIPDPTKDISDLSVVKDTAGDYLYFPEMTCNAMFISCGKLNNKFYAGPDVQKYYNKIGLNGSSEIGINHSRTTHFVHRVYGSEMNLRLFNVHRIENHNYIPPTRRKIYDETLPKMGLVDSKFELAGFVVVSWKDTMATPEEFNSF